MARRESDPPPEASEVERLRRENERVREDLRRSEAERQRLRRENEKLKDELEEAPRAVSRQSAPFALLARHAGRAAASAGAEAGRAYGGRAWRRHRRTGMRPTLTAQN